MRPRQREEQGKGTELDPGLHSWLFTNLTWKEQVILPLEVLTFSSPCKEGMVMRPASRRCFRELENPWSIPTNGDQNLGPAFGQVGCTGHYWHRPGGRGSI